MIWLLVILTPLLTALLLALPGAGRIAKRVLLPLAPLPALWLALTGPADGGAEFPSLVLGLRLGFGEAGQVFLLFTSILWFIAGVYAQGYFGGGARDRKFFGFFLMTMTGNFGLILAQDVPAFYSFFAMMTFSGFGLVIHSDTAAARRAARLYLITAILGEALLLGAVFLAVGAADSILLADLGPAVATSEWRNLIILLAFFGFGVKAGAVPVHFWLPLAHPVAPVPASAVLSGAMIKAGLLGWMHFLPLGQGEFLGWSVFLIIMGLLAAFGAVIAGCTQDEPKTVLAYSSISQMGVMTVALGIGLARPDAWVATLPVLLLYALNHALAKGALFFGTGIAMATGHHKAARWWVMLGLAVPALAIAGAPWTGGGIVKAALKVAAADVTEHLYPALDWLLPLTAIGTSLLLGRFLWLAWWEMRGKARGAAHPLMWFAWVPLVGAVVAAVGFATSFYAFGIASPPATVGAVWKNAWPILAGVGLLLVASRVLGGRLARVTVPAGDVVVAFELGACRLQRIWRRLPVPGPSRWKINLVEPLENLAESERRRDFANRVEEQIRHRSVPGVLFMLLALLLIAMLVFGTPIR
jgi:formate hydrogenlyase subunit 3/multisubunit Na+/H+ antiporter MnhD subunit